MDAAVITVGYRSSALYGGWLEALQGAWAALPTNDRGRLTLIVVDNSREIAVAAAVRGIGVGVNVILPHANCGFAAGCNLGLRHVTDECLVIMVNPDVLVAHDFFSQLNRIDFPPDLAAVGPRVVGMRGELEQSARRFPDWRTGFAGRSSLLARAFPQSRAVRRQLLARTKGEARDVDWISGACMIIPAARLRDVGEFDADYFMYWEDADWCFRASVLGLRVRYEPALVVSHSQGSSSVSAPIRTNYHFHRSALRYSRHHLGRGIHMAAAAVLLCARFVVTSGSQSINRIQRGGSCRGR